MLISFVTKIVLAGNVQKNPNKRKNQAVPKEDARSIQDVHAGRGLIHMLGEDLCMLGEDTFNGFHLLGKTPGAAHHPHLTHLDSLTLHPTHLPADMTVFAWEVLLSLLVKGYSQKAAPLTSASEVDVRSEAALIPHSPGSAGRVKSHLRRRLTNLRFGVQHL